MQIIPACKSQCKSKNSWDNSVLFILIDQVIATSQNKWKEGWVKSAENWEQIWINSALKFKCSTKWLKIKCQSDKGKNKGKKEREKKFLQALVGRKKLHAAQM